MYQKSMIAHYTSTFSDTSKCPTTAQCEMSLCRQSIFDIRQESLCNVLHFTKNFNKVRNMCRQLLLFGEMSQGCTQIR